jgi:hypothetical protein
MNQATGKWRDASGLVWTCTKVEGGVAVLERKQTVISGYDIVETSVQCVESLKKLARNYRRVE